MSNEDLYNNGVCILPKYLPEEKYISLRKDVSQYLKANVFQKNIKPAGKDVSFNTLRKLGKLYINKRIPQRDGDDGLIESGTTLHRHSFIFESKVFLISGKPF